MLRGLLLLAILLWMVPATARSLSSGECMSYALWSHDIIWARDVGADKAKVKASLVDAPGAIMRLVLLRFDSLWSADQPKLVVAEAVYRECMSRGGNYSDVVGS